MPFDSGTEAPASSPLREFSARTCLALRALPARHNVCPESAWRPRKLGDTPEVVPPWTTAPVRGWHISARTHGQSGHA